MHEMGTRAESNNGEIIYNLRGGATVLKGVVELVLVVALIGVVLGLAFGRNEFLNPRITEEQAYRMRIEAEALAAKNAYEQAKQQLELERQRNLLRQELNWREQDHQRWQQFWEDAATLILFCLSVGWVVLSMGTSVWIACMGVARLRLQRQAMLPDNQPGQPAMPGEYARGYFPEVNSDIRTDRGNDQCGQGVVKPYDRERLRAQFSVTTTAIR